MFVLINIDKPIHQISNLIIILKNIFVNRKVRIMKYIIGLDIGIGSVGWAVVRNDDDCKRLRQRRAETLLFQTALQTE